MEKTFTHFAAATLLCLLSASCNTEIDNPLPESRQNGTYTITAVTEQHSDPRTSLSDDFKVLWDQGDAISLLTSGSNDKFWISDGAGTGCASFTGEVSGSEPFYALYPYSEDAAVKGGCIEFSIPQVQKITSGSTADAALYAVAVQGENKRYAFKNICGILRLSLKGHSSIKTIKVQDLSGRHIWGKCSIALDGKEGTDGQSLSISGGGNTITVELSSPLALSQTVPAAVNVVLPAGSLKNGFSIALYNQDGDAVSFLTARNNFGGVGRSTVVPMTETELPDNGESADVRARGYYKDVFMDGSVGVSSRTTLPACPYIGYSLEYIATNSSSELNATDTLIMHRVFDGDAADPNGVLLFPDNEPRFRIVYVNGGNATKHGTALDETARNNFRNFVTYGGSYVGSCAGAYLACTGTHSGVHSVYLGIYPGICTNCNLQDTYTGHFVEPGSPLLKYYDFGGDMYVDHVYHNGGCFMSDEDLLPGGEILLRYDYPSRPMHKQGSVWAYKASNVKGRIIPVGSHPEGISDGERRDLMAAILKYAAEGNGDATVKANLVNGKEYVMTQGNKTSSKAGIGDGQYHHFTMEIPEGAGNIKIDLSSTFKDYDLYLTLRKGDFAWRSDADFVLAQSGPDKSLAVESLEPGTWYIGVCCATKPDASLVNDHGCRYYRYDGKNEAVTGVGYTLKASWNTPEVF